VFINQLRKQETGLVRKPKWTGTVTKYRLIWYFTIIDCRTVFCDDLMMVPRMVNLDYNSKLMSKSLQVTIIFLIILVFYRNQLVNENINLLIFLIFKLLGDNKKSMFINSNTLVNTGMSFKTLCRPLNPLVPILILSLWKTCIT
jgi:hypothetical protein